MSYKIVCDSCTDLTSQMKQDKTIELVPLTIQIGEIAVVDDETFNQSEFLKQVADYPDCPKSSCPSPQAYLDAYEGVDEVYVVTLSSQLSGSYNSAMVAKRDLEESKPDAKIAVFDSTSASVGQTLIAMKIQECLENGLAFDQVVEVVNQFRDELKTKFVLESLETLRKNGRLSSMKAIIANALNIKPIMTATEEGKIDKLSQARGMNKALLKMVEGIKEDAIDVKNRVVGISHCNNFERANYVKNEILKLVDFKDAIIVDTAGISSLYANDGGIIVCY